MGSPDYISSFWNELEFKLQESLPEVVKFILAKTGFESKLSLMNINSADISNIESCIDKNKLKWVQKLSGVYERTKKNNFKLSPGHLKIIFGIREYYKIEANVASDRKRSDQDRANAGR